MQRFARKITTSLGLALIVVFYVQISWLQSAYQNDLKRTIKLIQLSLIDDDIAEQINLQNEAQEKREITASYLDTLEISWRKFWQEILLRQQISSLNFEFKINTQSALENEPNRTWFKSADFEKNLNNKKYRLVESVIFLSSQEDVFVYGNQQNTYKVLFLYEVNSIPVWGNLWQIIVAVIAISILTISTIIIAIVSVRNQRNLEQIKLDFLNGMTHELNTPIAVIQLSAQYLQKIVKDKDEVFKETSQIILHETRRMSKLVSSILATARLQQSKFTLNLDLVIIGDILNEVINTYRLHLKNIDYEINKKYEAAGDVVGDEFHLFYALSNIIDNAIKYRDKTRKLKLEIRTYNNSSSFYIEIMDNGIGMKAEEMKEIFGRFFRVNKSTKDTTRGFGFGLAYVNEVIHLHKGKVTVNSKFGKGTQFIIQLPLA